MIYNKKEEREPCTLQPAYPTYKQPLHKKDGTEWMVYRDTGNNDQPIECPYSRKHRRSDTMSQHKVASKAAPSQPNYLTDREMVTKDCSLILMYKNYRDLILQYITDPEDIQALRSTCKALHEAIASPILDHHLDKEYLPEFIQKAEQFKFIRLFVSDVWKLKIIPENILYKTISLHIDEMNVTQLNENPTKIPNILEITCDEHYIEPRFRDDKPYLQLELTIHDGTLLKTLTINRITDRNPVGGKIRFNKHTYINIKQSSPTFYFRKFTLGALFHNQSLRYELNSPSIKSRVVIQKMDEGAEILLDRIESSNITIGEISKYSKVDISYKYSKNKYFHLRNLTIGKVAAEAIVGAHFKNIWPQSITYKATDIDNKRFLKELENIKKLTDHIWPKVSRYMQILLDYIHILKEILHASREKILACSAFLLLLLAIGPIGWFILTAGSLYVLHILNQDVQQNR